MVKVDEDGRIIQDTGTGGSWPVSTDRMAWALAAWELYCVTGERSWLRTAYDIKRYDTVADSVRQGMNKYLWQATHGYYGQYRYGRNYQSLSPRAEGLGEALSIIYGVTTTEQRERLARQMPVVPFGAPSFWPYIPNIPAYHNAGIWPQVVAFWTWASAEAGNTAGVEHGLAFTYRAAALFLTNKENMVASTGHFEGTELNSDRLIGSVAGNLAAIYRVFFGMRARPDRLVFEPFIPRSYSGERTLRDLRYREARLTVTVSGFGSAPARILLDGQPVGRVEIPATLAGVHTLEIVMNGKLRKAAIDIAENCYTPETPRSVLEGDRLVWERVPGAAAYTISRNGCPISTTSRTHARVVRRDGLGADATCRRPPQRGRGHAAARHGSVERLGVQQPTPGKVSGRKAHPHDHLHRVGPEHEPHREYRTTRSRASDTSRTGGSTRTAAAMPKIGACSGPGINMSLNESLSHDVSYHSAAAAQR